MTAENTQPAKSAPEPGKTRVKVELPTTLSDGTVLADLTIPQLLDKRTTLEHQIALQDERHLELRAIRAMIRRKA